MTDAPDANSDHKTAEVAAELHPERSAALGSEVRHWCEVWNTCLQNVLSQISGQPTVFEPSREPLPVADSDVWYTVVAGGAVRGEMTLRLPAASGSRLARKFLGEAETEADPTAVEQVTPEQKEALEELLRQIAGLAASALAATAGGEVQFHLAASSAPSWSSDDVICSRTRDEAGASIALEIQISPALAAELAATTQSSASTPTSSASTRPAAAMAVPSSASSSYGRLMDVGLDVKLRFGTRRMLLRDVLALSAGVVVELDNPLHSPVDLLLDGRLIAQGEVVIVDGKYGLRVTDIIEVAPAAG
jgi:flagellar motor switch protein FliN